MKDNFSRRGGIRESKAEKEGAHDARDVGESGGLCQRRGSAKNVFFIKQATHPLAVRTDLKQQSR